MNRALRVATVACCLLFTGCDGCFNVLDCSGTYLFQDWVQTSSMSADGGSSMSGGISADGGLAGAVRLDLSEGHFGSGQVFYRGECQYRLDIEADDSGATGTFSFSSPDPDSGACIAGEYTETWSMTCSSLTVTSQLGSETYQPPPSD